MLSPVSRFHLAGPALTMKTMKKRFTERQERLEALRDEIHDFNFGKSKKGFNFILTEMLELLEELNEELSSDSD